jgi:tachylectin
MYGVAQNRDLLWYRYGGQGGHDRSGNTGWYPNSGNPIGNGWQNFRHILGCGDGVILAIHQNGDLLWYHYEGDGRSDRSGSTGWHPNSGDPIGNGWQDFRHVFVIPRAGWRSAVVLIPRKWRERPLRKHGWHPNSGNPVGNGWQSFRHLFGGGASGFGPEGVIFGVQKNGDLLWYRYGGQGENDRSGTQAGTRTPVTRSGMDGKTSVPSSAVRTIPEEVLVRSFMPYRKMAISSGTNIRTPATRLATVW